MDRRIGEIVTGWRARGVQCLARPILTAKVRSASTETFDLSGKFATYRSVPSSQDYVLSGILSRRVETFRRTSTPDWLFPQQQTAIEVCHWPAVKVSIPLTGFFENLDPDDSGLGGQG